MPAEIQINFFTKIFQRYAEKVTWKVEKGLMSFYKSKLHNEVSFKEKFKNAKIIFLVSHKKIIIIENF